MPTSSLLVTDYLETCGLMHVFAGVPAILLLTSFYAGQKKMPTQTLSQLREVTEPNMAPPVCFTWPFAVLCSENFQQIRYFHNSLAVWPMNQEGMFSRRYQACLLKNSFSETAQNFHRTRMPFKRLSRLGWTFSIPKSAAVFSESDFFNTHRPMHSSRIICAYKGRLVMKKRLSRSKMASE
jgi:hypothetical protein